MYVHVNNYMCIKFNMCAATYLLMDLILRMYISINKCSYVSICYETIQVRNMRNYFSYI